MSNNIVKHGQLEDIAGDLWTKAKKRDIEELIYDPETKTIKGTNSSNDALSISTQLTNLVPIDKKAEFKQDVSSDNVAIANNKYMGSNIGFESKDRSLGFRQLTTSAFADGYVDHIRIYVDNANDSPTSTWKVWAITKGANEKESDTVNKVIPTAASLKVNSIVEGSETKKFVIIPVKESFENETYFIVRCDTHKLEVSQDIKTAYRKDVVNLNKSQPPDTANATIDWTYNADNNTAIMYLYGRESIGSLSLKLNQVQTDGSKYVLKSDTTDTGGTGQQGKVVKLGADGKLNTNMLPELAINRVLTSATKTSALALRGNGSNQLQLGDIVIITGEKNKAYMCKHETDTNFDNSFLELSLGNGAVKSVNNVLPTEANGNVSIDLANLPNVQAELNKKISNITLKSDKKHLTITKADNQTTDLDLTEAFKANNIAYGKDISGTNRATVENAIDALVEANNSNVKTIQGGRPNNTGNIEVAVAEEGTEGIKVTFGSSGGTAVKIATYMTEQEVRAIKDLFV